MHRPSDHDYATLCHELGHVYLGHLGTDEDRWWPSRQSLTRDQREIEAEAVAYVVLRRRRLVPRSAAYLTGYLRDPRQLAGVSVDAVVLAVARIEEMGDRSVAPRLTREERARRRSEGRPPTRGGARTSRGSRRTTGPDGP